MLPRILTPPDGNAHFESFRLFQQMYSVQHYICVFLSLSAVFNLGVSLLVYLTTISLSLSFCFQKVVEEESQVRKPSLDICSTGDKLADADPARKVSYHFPPCDTFPHSFPPPSSTLRWMHINTCILTILWLQERHVQHISFSFRCLSPRICVCVCVHVHASDCFCNNLSNALWRLFTNQYMRMEDVQFCFCLFFCFVPHLSICLRFQQGKASPPTLVFNRLFSEIKEEPGHPTLVHPRYYTLLTLSQLFQ